MRIEKTSQKKILCPVNGKRIAWATNRKHGWTYQVWMLPDQIMKKVTHLSHNDESPTSPFKKKLDLTIASLLSHSRLLLGSSVWKLFSLSMFWSLDDSLVWASHKNIGSSLWLECHLWFRTLCVHVSVRQGWCLVQGPPSLKKNPQSPLNNFVG